MSDFSGAEHEVVPGVLRGYRQWTFMGSALVRAMNFNAPWDKGRNEAQCLRVSINPSSTGGFSRPCDCPECVSTRHGPVPGANCACGFYALHEPAVSVSALPLIVDGVIKASGRVVLGTKGFRAQYVEIEAFYTMYTLLAGPLSFHYEVPVFHDYNEMREAFPPISVKELLPKPRTMSEEDIRLYWTNAPPITAFGPPGPIRWSGPISVERIKPDDES